MPPHRMSRRSASRCFRFRGCWRAGCGMSDWASSSCRPGTCAIRGGCRHLKGGLSPPPPIRVALTVDPARAGVDLSVADAVRRTGTALERAGYAVEEVQPPDVEA